MNIGIVGTGRMGTGMAHRLLETGHEVRVWNRSVDKAREAREAGAKWAPTLRELVSDSHVVISSLLDNAAVERVYGPDGLLASGVEGRLFIDMSTVSPGTHARIAAAMASRDAGFVECPVSGSIAAARSGTLVGFAGGELLHFAHAQPVLQQLCRRVEHVGPVGAGARMKLAANLLLVVFWQAFGEALLLADAPAADAARAIDLLADSNIGASILRARGPQIIAALRGDNVGAATFDVDTMRKDLRYMAQEALSHGSSLPLASRTLECLDRASREGGGGVDGVAYPAYWIAHSRPAPGTSRSAAGE
jgi:3-hydroxyisobutyrate dehydrogenase